MGYYDSGLSGWERRKMGLPNDHCGDGVIEEQVPVTTEPDVVEKEEVIQPNKRNKKSTGL